MAAPSSAASTWREVPLPIAKRALAVFVMVQSFLVFPLRLPTRPETGHESVPGRWLVGCLIGLVMPFVIARAILAGHAIGSLLVEIGAALGAFGIGVPALWAGQWVDASVVFAQASGAFLLAVGAPGSYRTVAGIALSAAVTLALLVALLASGP